MSYSLQDITWLLCKRDSRLGTWLSACKRGLDAPLLACHTSFTRLWIPILSAQALGFCVFALWILQLKSCCLSCDPPTVQWCLLSITYDQWRAECSVLDLQSKHPSLLSNWAEHPSFSVWANPSSVESSFILIIPLWLFFIELLSEALHFLYQEDSKHCCLLFNLMIPVLSGVREHTC